MYVAIAIAIMVALFSRAQAPGWLLEYVTRISTRKNEFALSHGSEE